MRNTVLRTPRLELVACSEALLLAETDVVRFAELLDVRIPVEWPPELYDEPARFWTLERVREAPEHEGWWMYYIVREGTPEREIVGIVGYKGPPDADGMVEVGYGVLTPHRRAGYATEATDALIARAFAHPEVRRVTAETLPELEPSIGVLGKLGFAFIGEGSEKGVIRYELTREAWEERAR
ncbi:MAG TPA: GNAT family protein [Longimicrobium sp.]|nr:GNAT family protein [Longimicrobium sp.]